NPHRPYRIGLRHGDIGQKWKRHGARGQLQKFSTGNFHVVHPIKTADHSALIFANLFTFAHFSVSSAMNLPKSAGEPANTPQPRSSRRLRIPGSASAALTSLLSLATTSGGVPAGAATPYQPLAS